MKRILFVDDEPKVLEGIQRMLRPMRHEWDMVFARSGLEALIILVEQPADVVVSDMRMPQMDGVEFLTKVMHRYPQIIRIGLSGHSEREMILRAVGPTHQYLAKPCDPNHLKDVVARAFALREVLLKDAIRQVVSQMQSLPSLPQLYVEMVEELRSTDASTERIGRIISKDIGMTAKVLQLVNSAFFGLQRHVADPSQAAVLLGLDTIQSLVLSIHVFSELDGARAAGLCIETLWDHSMATGALAKRISAAEGCEAKACDHALMAGLLHDAGKLVLAESLPEEYRRALTIAREQAVPQWQAEEQVLGTTHAEAGAYLLGLWGLPDPIVEALAYHHCPSACVATGFAPLTAVHAANVLEHQESSAAESPNARRLDADYLTRIGLAERLSTWRDLYRTLVQKETSP
ncbi:MAG: HDOD domain-containing protein [Phycisphaerae bacterium]|nr:HDOD domain-containing protein [Phycisphaerae bacterium]